MHPLHQPVSFGALKQSVSISQVLGRYGLFEHLHRSGDNLNGPCPLHAGHNPTQFRVSLSKNCWICFGDCQAGGSILDFVARKESVTIREAAVLLQQWFAIPTSVRPLTQQWTEKCEKREKLIRNRILPFRLRGLAYHPYLGKRGFRRESIATFGLGLCSRGCMAGRIVIPIHNKNGKLVAYAGRWPGEPPFGEPKYKLPPGFRKSLELFNLHRALAARKESSLKIVEGFFGCIAVRQAGFHKVVALMGSSISERQKEMIIEAAQPSNKVDLLFDEDPAGRKAREKACELLSDSVKVRVIAFPAEGQQPDRVSLQTLCALLA